MNIISAKFIKGIVAADELLDDGKDQIAFIGRSNVGKSSTINALTKKPGLAKTSSFPGRTQEINVFLINKLFYLIDLPGYGYTKTSRYAREQIQKLIYWYLLDSKYRQKKVVLIIDANVGPTENDLKMLQSLQDKGKDIIVIANKIDKVKRSIQQKQLKKIQNIIGHHKVIPFSTEKNIGLQELTAKILE